MAIDKEKKKELEEMRFLQDVEDAKYRARGVTVGTAFGGTTEITMRGPGANFLYTLLQPVEVIELIHQLSANVGCHLQLMPRKDFASWRDWKVSEEELAHVRGGWNLPGGGFPPFVNDMAPHQQIGANLPPPEDQSGRPKIIKQEKENVATKKAVNKRTTKRSRSSAK